jgi:hypothetical protein
MLMAVGKEIHTREYSRPHPEEYIVIAHVPVAIATKLRQLKHG